MEGTPEHPRLELSLSMSLLNVWNIVLWRISCGSLGKVVDTFPVLW